MNYLPMFVALLLVARFLAVAAVGESERARSHPTPIQPPEMVFIRGGKFLMGSPISDKKSVRYHPDERPQREIEVDGFYLSRFVVTAEEFARFLNDKGNHGYAEVGPANCWATIEFIDGEYRPREAAERCPATRVHWVGAAAFCEWLSEQTGNRYRLPTEAEWEFAARGSELRPWPWGKESPLTAHEATTGFFEFHGSRWMSKPYDGKHPWLKSPVGAFPENRTPDGVYDMLAYEGHHAGEWCSDEFDQNVHDRSSLDQERGTIRVKRGCAIRYANIGDLYAREGRKLGPWRKLLLRRIHGDTHEGRSWTRSPGDECGDHAFIRLAMDSPG